MHNLCKYALMDQEHKFHPRRSMFIIFLNLSNVLKKFFHPKIHVDIVNFDIQQKITKVLN